MRRNFFVEPCAGGMTGWMLRLSFYLFVVATATRTSFCTAQVESESEYAFDRREFAGSPTKGFEHVTALLKDAIEHGASEQTVARLIIEQTIMAFTCPNFGPERIDSLNKLEGLLAKPSPLLDDFETAKLYVEAVAFSVDWIQNSEKKDFSTSAHLQAAIAELGNAMSLTDRERFALIGYLRFELSCFFAGTEDFNSAIDWLKPVVDQFESLGQDEYESELVQLVTRQQSENYAGINDFDGGHSVVTAGITALNKSKGLSDARKLVVITLVLVSQLKSFRDHPSEQAAVTAWQEAEAHLKLMDSFKGENAIDVQLAMLGIYRTMVGFLGTRELGRSSQLVGQMLDEFNDHAELANSKTAYHVANEFALDVLTTLTESKAPQEKELRERIIVFEKRFEPSPTNNEPGRIK